MAATTYENFAWRESAPGVWQRDIDEAELFYTSLAKLYEGSGRMFFAITGHVSLTVEVPEGQGRKGTEQHLEDSLRNAWLSLRSEQPAIASRVIYDPETSKWKKTYDVVRNEVDQQAWIGSTFRVISTGQTGLEWCNSDPPAPSLPTLFVIVPPLSTSAHRKAVRRDIVIRSPHDIMDGVGTLHLLNRLVTIAADAYHDGTSIRAPLLDGSEVARLPPPYRVAAAIPQTPTPTQQQRLVDMAAGKSAPAPENGPEVIGIAHKKGAILPGRHQRAARTLSEDQTAHVLAACRAVGATVTHAYHAAIAISLRDMQDRGEEARSVQYHNYILRNERSHCIEPYNTAKYAAAVYHSVSGGSLVVEMIVRASTDAVADEQEQKDEFLGILNIMKDFYHGVNDDPDHYALAPYIWAASTPEIPQLSGDVLQQLPVPPPKASPSVSISSMGLVDKIIASKNGAFDVDNPWVTGEELGNGLGLFLGTFKGQLCCSVAYNDAWHDEESANSFLKRCEDVVFRGLGL
ncbi:Cytochrome p450 [Pleurostoma richardsiae]|uniref:Cytochrome p450 n=1 Tax=Pleurostoma richardsiae TaxID=41990 RepID=A0AA38RI56_9PEZI|nr:Cytochrome p450 [Pleurostoma richardsiae]